MNNSNYRELPPYYPEYIFPRGFNEFVIKHYVQRVSPGFVAKFARSWEDNVGTEETEAKSIQWLTREMDMLTEAHDRGVSVPKPRGLFLIPKVKRGFLNLFIRKTLPTPAILMQYIPGLTLDRLQGENSFEAYKLRDKEIRKAGSLGFDPIDCHEGNAIYNPLEKKVYLIDLEHWKRK